MNPRAYITVKADFRAFHRWLEAPEEVAFLRNYHRHVFQVELQLWVTHDDRQLEFFIVQGKLRHLLGHYEGLTTDQSCEMYAREIARAFEKTGHSVRACTVSEDGENSATVVE